MNRYKVIVLILAFLLMFYIVQKVNLKYSKLINYPIYKDLTGRLFVRFGNDQYVRQIRNEFKDGNLFKVNIPLDSIDLSTFSRVDSIIGPVTQYKDKLYLYTFHDGEEKLIIREMKK